MEKPSKLVNELGRLASGERKVLATCCVEPCLNEVEVVLFSEAELNTLKGGKAFYCCALHDSRPRS